MILFLLSLVVLVVIMVLQRVPGGSAIDIVTPLMVMVGLALRVRVAVTWACVMGAAYAVFVHFHPVALIALWVAVVLVLSVVGRGTEWQRPVMGGTIVFATAIVWRVAALLLGWFGGTPPTIDRGALAVLVAQPCTAVLVYAIAGIPLAHRLAQARTR